MYQQRRLAAELDYDGFYELDEAFHSMICEHGASARIWKIVAIALVFENPVHLGRLRDHGFPTANIPSIRSDKRLSRRQDCGSCRALALSRRSRSGSINS